MARIVMFYLSLLYFFSGHAQASTIEEKLANGLLAQAEYVQGDTNKPVVLLLHGFLTVHTFNLIQNIHNELASNQYSALAPSLTLGINKRLTSLDCNALHLHDMEGDLKEIDWWINWLIKKGHKEIILMGHSSGAVQLTRYASTRHHKEVVKLIALSLVPLNRKDHGQFTASNKLATKMLAEKNESIGNFSLAYCVNSYSSPAKNYMSYAQWDNQHILKTLHAVSINKEIIMGSDDIPVSDSWIVDMRTTGAKVVIINGADHFFGAGAEFELYDAILAALTRN